jgi:cytoskeletal protein CcmA (bactofilin family)
VFGLLLMLAGCAVHYEGDDALSRTFGSNFFGVGGLLNLTDPTAGDAFLAGGHINTASEVTGDLVAAGGEVSVGGGIGDDLYAAGGKVQVDAIVAGNARLAGGEVTVGPATVIDGSVTMSGGRVSFEGSTRGNLQASGGSVRIDGTVEADAEVNAEDVEIGPQTRIAGKLIVRGPRAPTIPEGAQIAGGVVFIEAAVSQHFSDHVHAVAQGVGSFLWILGVFVAGTLFTLAFPAYSARAADWIGRAPLRSLGLGFVLLVCLPVLAMLLVITIVGIPLALLIGMAYVLLLFLGWVTAALFVARKGLALLRGARPVTTGWLLLALLLAVLALWGVGQVPVLGGWVTFIALLLGIGALVWQGWPRRNPTATIAA